MRLPKRVSAAVLLGDGSFIVAYSGSNLFSHYDPLGANPKEFCIERVPSPGMELLPRDNYALAVTPDDRFLLVADYRAHLVSIIDLVEHALLKEIPCPGSPLRFQSVSSTSALVVHDHGVCALDFDEGMAPPGPVGEDAIRLSEDETYSLENGFAIHTTAGREARISLQNLEGPGALALSPSFKYLYAVLSAGRLLVLDTSTERILKHKLLPSARFPRHLSLSYDGNALALWTPELGDLQILNAHTLEPDTFNSSDIADLRSVCFSSSTDTLLVVGGSSAIRYRRAS